MGHDNGGTSAFSWREFLAPTHWPTWLGIGVLWLMTRLPLNAQLAVGRAIGITLYHLVPSRRRVALTNLALAFPDLTQQSRIELARDVYRHMGMALAEMAYLWFCPLEPLQRRFRFEGAEHIDAALASGRGVIMLQAHFTTLEVCGGIVGARWPVSAVYDNPKNPLYAAWLLWQRQRHLTSLIDNRDIRNMVRRLKRGEMIWYSPDQTVSQRHGGIPTNYFSQAVLTTAGTARMLRLTNAVLIPFVPSRNATGSHYVLTCLPPLELDTHNIDEATQRVNDLFEAQVRAQPEQYFWVHKRFRPPTTELPNPYQQHP